MSADGDMPEPDEGLAPHELSSLTLWGSTCSAQVRSHAVLDQGAVRTSLVVFHLKDAPRSRETGRPFELPEVDARKLRDLLNAATDRGLL